MAFNKGYDGLVYTIGQEPYHDGQQWKNQSNIRLL